MTSALRARTTRAQVRACAGCLDSKACWVCLGSGHAVPEHLTGTCARCAGSGVCDVCAVPRQRGPSS